MRYKGQLVFHSEMCCGCWPQFHDDRGLNGDENQYWDWDWTINFNKKTKLDLLELYDKDDNLIYSGTWTYDRYKTGTIKHNGENLYYPCCKEISKEDWLMWNVAGCRAIIETDFVIDALDLVKMKEKEEYQKKIKQKALDNEKGK